MPDTFVKRVSTDEDYENEIELQRIASSYGFSPRILDTQIVDEECLITMENFGDRTLANIYGTETSDIPLEVWNAIRSILTILYEVEGIEYPDITPYNFMEVDEKIYIIDFGDAKYKLGEPNWFLAEFMDGENSWNPDYK